MGGGGIQCNGSSSLCATLSGFTHLFLFVLIFYIECETEGVYPQSDGGPAMAFAD